MKNFDTLNDKVVFITGASTGLGEKIAYEAAKKGAVVIVSARREDMLLKVKATCEEHSGKKAYAFSLDVSDPEQVKKVIEEIYQTVGVVDVLVNNAGFGHFEEALTFDMDLAERMFRVNVLGLMYVTQLVAIEMAERRQGHIINIASQAGKMATPKSTIYSASKFAVIGYSNALRLELKPLNIFVTTVNPGPIETNFFDIADESGTYLDKVGRYVLNAEDVANRIVALMGTSRRELNLPALLEVAGKFYTIFPRIGDYLAGNLFNNK
ncbi:oxidoreductase, short-chain dehydrogenase/reductase family protein [Carnobacterium sp. AT7]|uniref:SDR family NAD(P)-dependent oxidoreductase n=1 Tax=Carnobacterium sp. AT7 TaxID=333990 RepID=UPI00015F2749|nr:SDR family oxidoreductase [Carnobacterium sp. AT7]EDP67495.1 oxidoreductase, short-chain dehydrogenase/reductase family protein [Carnobacterium sp. AT7]